jgi:hypothetical protein
MQRIMAATLRSRTIRVRVRAAVTILPPFPTIDTKVSQVGTLGGPPRMAPIQRMEVVVHDEVGFVAFGNCVPRP